jgi:hypothetical protein
MSRDASSLAGRWCSARRFSSAPTFYSIYGFQARIRVCTKHLSGLLIGALSPPRVPETHPFPRSSIQSRPGSIRPVSLGLERGAELVRETPIGALRMFGGEVDLQSSLQIPGMLHEAIACSALAGTDLRISRRLLGLALPSVLLRTWLQLDGWIIHPRSFMRSSPESDPYRMRAPW